MTEPSTREQILGEGAGGPLTAPGPWTQYSGYIYYAGGGIIVGNPSGGNFGIGTINAINYYVNGQLFNPAVYLQLNGGTMNGPLILAADPTTALGAATKQYADGKLALTGGSMTGSIILPSDPTVALAAATKQYVDNKAGNYLPLTGGTMTGSIVLPSDPTLALAASTKQYVDNSISPVNARFANYLALTGGTMTGSIILPSDPTTALAAATKQYVDARASGFTMPDAPNDGNTYGRYNLGWSAVFDAGTF